MSKQTLVTASLTNMLISPAAIEPGSLAMAQGAPAGLQTGEVGGPQSFTAAMQTLQETGAAGVSGPSVPAERLVAMADFVRQVVQGQSVIASQQTGDLNAQLSTGIDPVLRSSGDVLPETGVESGNILPLPELATGLHKSSQLPLTTLPGASPAPLTGDGGESIVAQDISLKVEQGKPNPALLEQMKVAQRLFNAGGEPAAVADHATSAELHSSRQGTHSQDPTAASKPPLLNVPGAEVAATRAQLQRTAESLTMYTESNSTVRAAESVMSTVSDAAPVSTTFATSQGPMQSDQSMELPQLQNMRPLQPLADFKGFTEGLGQRLTVMLDEGVQSARLQLYPENLGKLEIKIQVEDNIARVWFSADQGHAREILESALPRLRDQFMQKGMELIQADVGAGHDQGDAKAAYDGADEGFSTAGVNGPENVLEPIGIPGMIAVSDRGLDIYV